jgi:hypothetical protein
VNTADTLRPPWSLESSVGAYKDWLHVNLYDHDADVVGLVNVSIHGTPGDPTTHVVATALFDVGGDEWIGNVGVDGWADASIALTGVSTGSGSVAFGTDGRILAAATIDELRLRLVATPATDAYAIETPHRFGSGWIGWRVVPSLAVEGPVVLRGVPLAKGGQVAYHDHTWGRWHWGDDIGWEWGSFLDRTGSSIVIGRTSNRAHDQCGPFSVVIDHHGVRRSFSGARVSCRWGGAAGPPSRRLPGALAALHDDLRRPRLPSTLHITAQTGADRVELAYESRSVVQLILADPAGPGSSALHEMSGHFEATGRLAGRPFGFEGLGMVERLE